MASLLSMVFAGFAFAGAGFVVKKLGGDGGIGKEMARHNAATERLAIAKEK